MAAITYSKRQLIERLKKQIASDFPGDDFKLTTNELLLFIDAAIPGVLKAQMYENAKISGVLDVPEAYLVNYQYTISNQNTSTNEWSATLAQTPLELPTGYDITNVYLTDPAGSRSFNGFPIKNKRVAYRDTMPSAPGFSYRLEGQTILLKTSNGSPLLGYTLNVQMPVSRTSDLDAAMNLPDGAIEPIFDTVMKKIQQRYQIPQDVVEDDLPAGNKGS